jgi:hypothetical protein
MPDETPTPEEEKASEPTLSERDMPRERSHREFEKLIDSTELPPWNKR